MTFVVASFLVACGGSADVDGGVDAPVDAAPPSSDVRPEVDAPDLADGSAADASAPDAAIDATVSPADAGADAGCVAETCNLYDDDCDGHTDEGACGGCTAMSAPDGSNYLFCPETMPALRAWGDRCAQHAPGYALAPLEDSSSFLFARTHVSTRAMWVGIRAFGRGVTGIVDSAGSPHTIAEGERDPLDVHLDGERCFALGPDGLIDVSCIVTSSSTDRGYVCRGLPTSVPPTACGTETCNGLDDDCDGRVDDGACSECDVASFLGHVYYFCSGGAFEAALDDCAALPSAAGAMIDSPEENQFLAIESAPSTENDSWIGARTIAESTGDAGTRVVMRWVDGREIGGSDAPFTNFAMGPNTEPGRGLVLRSSTSVWRGGDPIESRAVICEGPIAAGP